MNKILQIGLISAIFATSGMASTLPDEIESGAKVILNESITELDRNVVNRGQIRNGTQNTDLTIAGTKAGLTVTNIPTVSIEQITNDTLSGAIKTANSITQPNLVNVYEIKYPETAMDESITGGENVTIENENPTLDTDTLKELESSDLLYLGGASESGKTVKIAAPDPYNSISIKCSLVDQGGSGNSYEIETSGTVIISKSLSNYKNGNITITNQTTTLSGGDEIYSPINVCNDGKLYISNETELYSNITIKTGGIFSTRIGGKVTLKAGATLTIGATDNDNPAE